MNFYRLNYAYKVVTMSFTLTSYNIKVLLIC